MKITHNKVGQNLNSVDGAKSGKAEGAAGVKDGKVGAVDLNSVSAKGSDVSTKVDLSERGQEAKRIKELANAAPDMDMAKVEKFRNLIDSGQYKVDPRAVADRMVDEHLAEESMMEAKN